MKTSTSMKWLLILFMAVTSGCRGSLQTEKVPAGDTLYYAVEMNGVVCGYAKLNVVPGTFESIPVKLITEDVSAKFSLLGQGMDIEFHSKFIVDSANSSIISIDRNMKVGGSSFQSTTRRIGDKVQFKSTLADGEKSVDLPGDAVIESPLSYPHLLRDFITGNETEKIYQVFDDLRGNLEERRYTFKGYEEIELVGLKYTAAVFDELNLVSGTSVKIWIRKEDAFPLKTEVSGRTISLSDQNAVKLIAVADIDETIFARVNKLINNIHDIRYMKVKGTIQTAGQWITVDSLNFPGQRFTGTVENNLVDGIFEMEPVRYDGAGAPPFPPDFGGSELLQKYLEPGEFIESDDPLIISEAKKITEGSADSWEAAVRLSKWVAEEIRGAIPGGTSAINTYKIREGECGGHSRLLTAFCRAVGIPARISVGCMYTPHYGGSFGQHAWTEIWMGDAGWIAVDATAFEFDFVDAGHIRLGERTTFNPRSMEILDYRMTAQDSTAGPGIPEKYLPYTAKYTILESGKVFTVVFRENDLYVEIPGQMPLPLNDPDDEGRWYPKFTRQVNFSFPRDSTGKVDQMILQQLVPVARTADPDQIGDEVPDELQPFLGSYSLPQAQLNLTVLYREGTLYVLDSRNDEMVKLARNQDNARWKVTKNNDEIEFNEGSEGRIQALVIYSNVFLARGEPVSDIIEKVIEQEGIDKGIAQYDEIKNQDSDEVLFSESLLNMLGYKYLYGGKTDEAIAVFDLNVREYPESFNVYDSLGEAYMKKGDMKLAKANYKQSLKLNPENENGRMMLEKIKSGE